MTTEQILEQLHERTSHAIQVELLEILQENNLANSDKALTETDYEFMNIILDRFYNKNLNQKAYYLFGYDAVYTLEEEGIDALIKASEDNELGFKTYCYEQGKDTPTDLLWEGFGANDFALITEEEYNKLNQ